MLNLCNNVKDPADLFSKEKKIVLYGAGASAKLILASYYKRGLSGSLRSEEHTSELQSQR